jgi:hypothetical protein
MKCPGQNTRNWTFTDIFEIACQNCGVVVEFFKDDPYRVCGACGIMILNPRLDLGCRNHCDHANQCRQEQNRMFHHKNQG